MEQRSCMGHSDEAHLQERTAQTLAQLKLFVLELFVVVACFAMGVVTR